MITRPSTLGKYTKEKLYYNMRLYAGEMERSNNQLMAVTGRGHSGFRVHLIHNICYGIQRSNTATFAYLLVNLSHAKSLVFITFFNLY